MLVLAAFACLVAVLAACVVVANNTDAATAPPATGGGICGATGTFAPMPSWAVEGPLFPSAVLRANGNKTLVRSLNAKKQCVDFVLYGDSIVADLGSKRPYAGVFRKHFGDVNAVALGVGATNVEQLTWRITSGSERLDRAPKCIALLIGTNNVGADPGFQRTAGRMDELLMWLRAAYPSSTLVVMALLPTTFHDTKRANALYRDVAARRGAVFVECGQTLNPRDKSVIRDGIHPAEQGHDTVLRCLRQAVDAYIT